MAYFKSGRGRARGLRRRGGAARRPRARAGNTRAMVRSMITKLAAPVQVIRSMCSNGEGEDTPYWSDAGGASMCLNAGSFLTGVNQNITGLSTYVSGSSWYGTATNHQFQEIRMKALDLKAVFDAPLGGSMNFRIMLVYSRMSKGAFTGPNNVLDNVDAFYSQYNYNAIDFNQRYRILYDKFHRVDCNVTPIYSENDLTENVSAPPGKFLHLKFHWPKGLRTNYSLGNTGTAADIDDGALFLMILGDNAENSFMNFTYTLEYTDYQPKDKRI